MNGHILGLLSVLLLLFVLSASSNVIQSSSDGFYIEGNSFVKDGTPVQLISGSFHYFRCHPALWRDRLEKMVAAGLNAVQTYIPWNLHEPEYGVYDFARYNFTSFIEMAGDMGLMVIIRPGPYSCGEWEFGGFPSWLLTSYPEIALRSSDPNYIQEVTRWFSVLLPMLSNQLYSTGSGPIIMAQLENEYGSYGSDKLYLNTLYSLFIKYLGDGQGRGSGVVIHSTDGSGSTYLYGSQIQGVYQTIDFGPTNDPSSLFAIQRQFEPVGPLMNSEYYPGWLTHWLDSSAASVPVDTVVDGLTAILELNASVNLYMFYGGSNFEYYNGANGGGYGDYEITIQSYDYDAPISEWGGITPKYTAIRQAIQSYTGKSLPPVPSSPQTTAYGVVSIQSACSLFDNLENVWQSQMVGNTGRPLYMEELNQSYGFVLYTTSINPQYQSNSLTIDELHDRASFYINEEYQGFVQRPTNNSLSVQFDNTTTINSLYILLENQGRVNYGNYLLDRKGLGKGVMSSFQYLGPWNNYPISLDDIDTIASVLQWDNGNQYYGWATPSFYRTTLTIKGTPTETFLSFNGLGKGQLFVNGFNVGRYWNVGPQRTMYIPSTILLTGSNDIILFETLGLDLIQSIEFVSQPIFD